MNIKKITSFVPFCLSLFVKYFIDPIHIFWYRTKGTWDTNEYLGFPIRQLPSDMWLYQEIVFRTQPQHVIQTGVFLGGSVLYFANLLDAINAPATSLVIGIDIQLTDKAKALNHPRIRLLEGDSAAPETISRIEQLIGQDASALVSLDSDHSQSHVLRELKAFSRFVPVEGYLVVEDTNVNGNPVYPSHGPGPLEAVQQFLKSNRHFMQDEKLWKKNHFSFHQHGWLKRIS